MDVRQFVKRKSISHSGSVENNSDKDLRSESVQPAQTNERTAKVVVDSSSPIQFHQLRGAHNITICSRHFMVCTYSSRNSHLLGINNAK